MHPKNYAHSVSYLAQRTESQIERSKGKTVQDVAQATSLQHKPSHQATTLDEFTVARIHRLWEDWLRLKPTENGNKHHFHQKVIKATAGLEYVRLATIYVLLARYDAALSAELSPA